MRPIRAMTRHSRRDVVRRLLTLGRRRTMSEPSRSAMAPQPSRWSSSATASSATAKPANARPARSPVRRAGQVTPRRGTGRWPRGSRASARASRVDPGAERDAVVQRPAVELIEELLGERERRRAGGGEARASGAGLPLELGIGHHPATQAGRPRLLGARAPARSAPGRARPSRRPRAGAASSPWRARSRAGSRGSRAARPRRRWRGRTR